MINFNPPDKAYIVSWQSDLENTKESILPVCDKPYHKIKENMPLGEELKNVEISIVCRQSSWPAMSSQVLARQALQKTTNF